MNCNVQAEGQPKGTKGQQQGKGGKQQKGSKKQDKQKQKQQEQVPQQQKAGSQPSGSKGDKQVPSKDEKPSSATGESSDQPQKTKAELKAERRAIQVSIFKFILKFSFLYCVVSENHMVMYIVLLPGMVIWFVPYLPWNFKFSFIFPFKNLANEILTPLEFPMTILGVGRGIFCTRIHVFVFALVGINSQ